jgi:hypothetical protein
MNPPDVCSDDFKRYVAESLRMRAKAAAEQGREDDVEYLLERAVWMDRLVREPS